MGKPSALVLSIMSKSKKPPMGGDSGGDAMEGEDEGGEDVGRMGALSAAKDILAAIKANDAAALSAALADHAACCSDEE